MPDRTDGAHTATVPMQSHRHASRCGPPFRCHYQHRRSVFTQIDAPSRSDFKFIAAIYAARLRHNLAERGTKCPRNMPISDEGDSASLPSVDNCGHDPHGETVYFSPHSSFCLLAHRFGEFVRALFFWSLF